LTSTLASFILAETLPSQSSRLPLADEVVVFTGKLSSLGRKEAQALVIRLGGSSADEVSARTTLVVVGAEGFAGSEKSEKLKKAEESGVRVMSENDFCRMAGIHPPEDLKQQYYGQRDLLSMYPASARTTYGIWKNGASSARSCARTRKRIFRFPICC
jgi:hypothetical protein